MNSVRNKIRLSVIIPFYNAERHIEECVRSLMNQTMRKEIEFIFIDDGSTDGSRELVKRVVDSFPARPSQVRILSNQRNSGTAFSRQRGIDAARGDYFIHCDADDWVDPDMYATMMKVADSTDADVVCTPYYLEKRKGRKKVAFSSLDFPLLNEMPLDTLHCSLWNKLIRRSVVVDNKLRLFEGVDCWEDLGLMFRVAIFTRRIVIYNHPFYHYRKADASSLCTERMDRVLSDHLRFVEAMDAWFAGQPPVMARHYQRFILFARFTAKIKMLRNRPRDLHRWLNTYPEANRHIMSYSNVPFFYRICFWIADIFPEWLVGTLLRIF